MNYDHTIRINNRTLVFQEPIEDPFINATVSIGWWDRVKSLFSKKFEVTVIVGADRDTIRRIMNLDQADFSKIFVDGPSEAQTS